MGGDVLEYVIASDTELALYGLRPPCSESHDLVELVQLTRINGLTVICHPCYARSDASFPQQN
jgi:hypothetical protein